MDIPMYGNAMFRWYLLALTLTVSFGCGTTTPFVKYSDSSYVTIQHTNFDLTPTLTRQVRDLAESYCNSQGASAEYTGIVRDSGLGPEEFDFKCVRNTAPQRQAPAVQAQTAKEPPPPQSGTGSGFFVSKVGHVITNAHVVKGCNKVTVGDNANKQVPAEIINTDGSNDLALLKLSPLEMASAESKSLIQKLSIVVVPLASKGLLRSEDVRLGEKVLVAGYPFGDVFSNTIKVTSGIVSATRGAGDDSGQFQLDAAVQPGNSGGPIYDSGGNIVGVVISQLDKLKVAKAIGSLPENVNFGIKASTVRQFLISSGLPSKKSEQTEEKSTEQLAEIAQNQALMVMCLQ
jgi:serine protease Do